MATSGHDLSEFDREILGRIGGGTVGVVVSSWNEEITSGLLRGAIDVLRESKAAGGIDDFHVHHVPGSFELPLGAQFLFEAKDVDAVICIGSVIRGETSHFDYVCSSCSKGIMDVGLKFNKPCVFCVLTDDNIEQSKARSGGEHGNKGTEGAVTALKMLLLKKELG